MGTQLKTNRWFILAAILYAFAGLVFMEYCAAVYGAESAVFEYISAALLLPVWAIGGWAVFFQK